MKITGLSKIVFLKIFNFLYFKNFFFFLEGTLSEIIHFPFVSCIIF
jgi:hypothetical protein